MHGRSIGFICLPALFGLVLTVGCRTKDSPPDSFIDAAPQPDAPPVITSCDDGSNAIAEVQDVSMPPDTPVALCGVVVTAIDTYGSFQNTMFVQDPAGGDYSGIMVYFGDAGLPTDIQVGDEVNVLGALKAEFALNSDTSGESMTELVAPDGGAITVEYVGPGTVPDPVVVDPVALAADNAEAERYEAMLVTFQDVRVVSTVARTGDSAHADVTGPFEVQGNLTDQVELFEIDSCLVSITGVIDYFSGFQLLPRSIDDIALDGTNCPPIETDATLCQDGVDNDFDGFMDCQDFACQATVPECVPDTTVMNIQNGTIAEDTQVTLAQVAVSAITRDRLHLWIMDVDAGAGEANAGPYNGVYVYRGMAATPLDPAIEVGTLLAVEGRTYEYFGYTELTNPVLTPLGGTVPVNGALGVTTGVLGDDASNEAYEGVLIQLENVPITMADADAYGSFLVNDGSGDLRVGDWSYDFPAQQQDDCFATLIGVMHRFSTGVSLSPRGPDDMVLGGTCN